MKQHILILCITSLLIFSCNLNNTDEKKAAIPPIVNDSLPRGETPTATGDNSSNSLDWQGIYKGIVPCADCEGIETNLLLNKDLTYSLKTKYLGKNGTTVNEKNGSFLWNKDGTIITLDGIKNPPSQYLVGENKLIQLDMSGNRITGALAEKYQLKKMQH